MTARPEAALAVALRKRLRDEAPRVVIAAFANAAKRGPYAQRQVKAEGLQPGMPDLAIVWPGGGCGFLELKAGTRKLTDNQAEWQERLAAMGHNVGVARSVETALALLAAWGAPFDRPFAREVAA